MRYSADEFQSALHDKFICQSVEGACELFMSNLQSASSTGRNSVLYWCLLTNHSCKMNMTLISRSSTFWQMDSWWQADWNSSAKHLLKSTTCRIFNSACSAGTYDMVNVLLPIFIFSLSVGLCLVILQTVSLLNWAKCTSMRNFGPILHSRGLQYFIATSGCWQNHFLCMYLILKTIFYKISEFVTFWGCMLSSRTQLLVARYK